MDVAEGVVDVADVAVVVVLGLRGLGFRGLREEEGGEVWYLVVIRVCVAVKK